MSLSAEEKIHLETFLNTTLKNQATHSDGFTNFMDTQHVGHALVINVENKEALKALLLQIQAMNKLKNPEDRILLRVAAGGREDIKKPYSASFSATACTSADVVVRLTGQEFRNLKRIANSDTVRVGPSMQIGELNKALYEKEKLALRTASLIPYVTVGGLFVPGGHGTGVDEPSFAGSISGATLMLENGKETHIDSSHPDFATIMGANNGMFGLVIDVDIPCTPAKKIQCVMEKRSVAEFMEEVEQGLFQNDPYVSAMYVPTYLPDELTNRGSHNVIILRFRPVPLETENSHHYEWLSNLEQKIEINLEKDITLADILRHYPEIIPFYMRHMAAPLTIGKREQIAVGPWYEMMHYLTQYPSSLNEICGIFPVKDQAASEAQGQEIVKALKNAITLLGEHAKRGEYPITYAMYFRFLQGTNGGLSFTAHPAGHHVCAMDLTSMANMPGFAAFEQSMQQFFLNDMQAKFHWGKNAPLDLDYQKLYGSQWFAVKDALERWHHTHHTSLAKSTLLNPLFSKVLGYPVPNLVEAAIPQQLAAPDALKLAKSAKKLVSMLKLADGEGELLKEKINADIQNNKKPLFVHTLFKGKRKENTQEELSKKSRCSIL